MRIRLMTFRYSATLGGFDSEPLRDFLRDKEVIAFREHFFCVNDVPHLTCIVTYQTAIVPQAALDAARENAAAESMARSEPRYESRNATWAGRAGRRDGRPDPRAGLDERERALYDSLAQWRGARARGGCPALSALHQHATRRAHRGYRPAKASERSIALAPRWARHATEAQAPRASPRDVRGPKR